MDPRDTKYDPNSIPNLANYNSTPVVTELYIYDTYLTNSNLANMHATLKPSMLELSCTRIELSSFAAHLEQPNEADPVTLSIFGQNTGTVAIPSITPLLTMLPISLYWCALDLSLTMTVLPSRMTLKVFFYHVPPDITILHHATIQVKSDFSVALAHASHP